MTDAKTAPAGSGEARELVEAALDALEERSPFMKDDEVGALPEVLAIAAAPDSVRRHCILLSAYHDRIEAYPDKEHVHWYAAMRMLKIIASRPAGLTADDIGLLLPVPADKRWDAGSSRTPDEFWLEALLPQIEYTWQSLCGAGRDSLRARLRETAAATELPGGATRLLALTDDAADYVPLDYIGTGDAVGQSLRDVFSSSPEEPAALAAVIRLLAAYPADGKPKAQWRKNAVAAAAGLSAPVTLAAALLSAAAAAPDVRRECYDLHESANISYVTWADFRNEAVLWGLAGLAAVIAQRYDGADLLPRLRALAHKAITYLPERSSPRSLGLATRCVAAIAEAALPESLPELLRVERGFRHGTIVRKARRAVASLAARQGLSRDELLELAVESHGLAPDGTRRVELAGGWAAVLAAGPRTATVSYLGPGGKSRASLPAAVKARSAEALSELKKDLKAVRATVTDERTRLDGFLACGHARPVRVWRERYLGHPVTGQLTRTLIWRFTTPDGETVTGLPAEDAFPAAAGLIMRDGTSAAIPEDAEVRLWHPVTADGPEVAAWRSLLLQREIIQPVRQAFREVYVPTPAEEATRDYSNRFAGHVFQQVQARALMKGRAWKPVPLASGWDDGIDQGVARKEYPDAGVRAEFFFDYSGSDERAGDLDAYVTSDQVRFFDMGTGGAVPLERVPSLIFTETMRDVDLFIGVTSIGNDPQWLDRGEGRRFGDTYWHRFSFGDLPARGEVRRDVLSRLVPMLTIADRCTLQDRFLEVRGDLRTYRIHLGSGNILMSPNDQYLCIVTARGAQAGKIFLPFDDDPVLTGILSKAFLLAADTAITDPAITRQITPRQ